MTSIQSPSGDYFPPQQTPLLSGLQPHSVDDDVLWLLQGTGSPSTCSWQVCTPVTALRPTAADTVGTTVVIPIHRWATEAQGR